MDVGYFVIERFKRHRDVSGNLSLILKKN